MPRNILDLGKASRPSNDSLSNTRWRLRLIALNLVAGAISADFAWADQFYRGISENSIVSFPAFDYPWMPRRELKLPASAIITSEIFNFRALGHLMSKTL